MRQITTKDVNDLYTKETGKEAFGELPMYKNRFKRTLEYINWLEQKVLHTIKKAAITGKTYTDSKGKIYPVYQGSRGGFYFWAISRNTGKAYKRYLKLN